MKNLILLSLILSSSLSMAFDWNETRTIINKGISEKTLPGAVLVVGNEDGILLNEAFGNRSSSEANSTETLYDIASLTKIVATTTSVMLLEERGQISLKDTVQSYFPEFAGGLKSNVTIEHLLRHDSGLPAGLSPKNGESFKEYFSRVLKVNLLTTPGVHFAYSDLGFIVLAAIVEKVSGKSMDEFANENIFIPLEMTSTTYHVPEETQSLCAPTIAARQKCEAHDPLAFRFRPEELGHAGIFSTAEDLSHLFSMYLNLGKFNSKAFMKEETVKKMITLPEGKMRGLGFDLISPYSTAPRGSTFPAGISFGHTGYTGTSFWIDPVSKSFYILLSNRVYLGDELTTKKFMTLRFDVSSAIGKQLN